MLKKLLICVVAVMVMLITVISALEIGDEFYLYGRDNEKLSEVISMTEAEIGDYCKQNSITLLAVNKDNTRQIRQIKKETEFSKEVKSLSVLSDGEILKLTADLSGFENVKGEIIKKDALKYLKIQVKSKDSGGEYTLIQYITVKDGKTITLSFYTTADESTDYVEKIFNSQFNNLTVAKTWVVIALALLFGLAAALSIMIVRDLNVPKDTTENNA